ncbi:MAG TPA: hypothetical protein DIT40_08825, partial [Alphaproteobacteria bacterium]|nr:hypothetical protein [Alphaproteobacteria bacterium]
FIACDPGAWTNIGPFGRVQNACSQLGEIQATGGDEPADAVGAIQLNPGSIVLASQFEDAFAGVEGATTLWAYFKDGGRVSVSNG